MKGSVVQTLILSDWHRHRMLILLSIASGGLALGLIQVGGEVPFMLGTIWYFTVMVVFGCMLPPSNLINERKKQTLPFLMSLPISVTQFTAAKIISTVGIFLVPWLTLVIAAVAFIFGRHGIPHGIVPVVIILATVTFVGFSLIAGVALVSESEGATIAATIAANSSYGFSWFLLVRNPVIRAGMQSPQIVWSREVLTVLGAEFAVIFLILGLTFYLQSRKRDFV
jgi:ABC-2 type transport system permease protein